MSTMVCKLLNTLLYSAPMGVFCIEKFHCINCINNIEIIQIEVQVFIVMKLANGGKQIFLIYLKLS